MRLWILILFLVSSWPALAVNQDDPNLNIGRSKSAETQGQFSTAGGQILEPIPLDKIILLPDELLNRMPSNDSADEDDESEE